MKKLIALVLVLCLLPLCAMAETVTLPLADGTLTFDAFEGGYVLTAETSASVFNRLGMSQRELLAWMAEEDVDALLYDAALGCEVLISVYEEDGPALSSYTLEERQQICDSFRENYEQYGYIVHGVDIQKKGEFTCLYAYITLPYEDGSEENRIVYETLFGGYHLLMTMFTFEGVEPAEYVLLADRMAQSMRYTPNPGLVKLGLPGVSLQLSAPEGMTVHASVEEAGVTLAEPAAAEVVGCMADPAGEWYVLWQVDESASGDMERLSAAGVRALYEARAKSRRFLGCTVTLTESHPESRQVYIRMAYQFTDESGAAWYAEEYYTKQDGWGVIVTVYSPVPLTEDVQAMLENVINSQMVTVTE